MSKRTNLQIGHLKTRSLFTGFADFKRLVYDSDFDLFPIAETWLLENMSTGGGVAIYAKPNMNVKVIALDFNRCELEYLLVAIKVGKFLFAFGIVYRVMVTGRHSSRS